MSPTPMDQDQRAKLDQLLWRRAQCLSSSEEAVRWATEALAEGMDSPNLCILAGLLAPEDWSEIEHYLTATLADFGMTEVGLAEMVRERICRIAARILNGGIPPYWGGYEVYTLCQETGFCEAYHNWCYLGDGLDPLTASRLVPSDLDAAIMEEAKSLLAAERDGAQAE